jgi:hypothetical protein
MRIFVEQKHIDAGIAKDARGCPIYLAIMDQADVRRAGVTCDDVYIEEVSGSTKLLRLPDNCIAFIDGFDPAGLNGGTKPEPFSFELSGVEPREMQRSLPCEDIPTRESLVAETEAGVVVARLEKITHEA